MRTVHTQFNEKNLTGNAGLTLFGKFAKKINILNILENNVSIARSPQAEYSVAGIIFMFMFGILAGGQHISHMAIIGNDTALRNIFEWIKWPVASTFGRVFKLFTQKHCVELSNAEAQIRKKVWGKKWFGRVTMDMDSSVKGVYGNQEGAQKGYNPKKRGQKSYHPLFCFIAETRECLHNWFRTGSAYSANGSVEFMKECIDRLSNRVWKIAVRADSAFYSGDLFDYLEQNHCLYLVKAKLNGLDSILAGLKWTPVKKQPGFEQAEFTHKCAGWKKARRFVVVRCIDDVVCDDLLFGIPKITYSYFCYVTNMDLTPWGAHKYYGKRATSENWIEWCKNQMASGSVLTQNFWANSAIFQACVLAYNLMVWMMWLNDKKGFSQEPQTIRMFLIHAPARLRQAGRQWFLRLPEDFAFKERWQKIEASIDALTFA